VVPLKGQTNEQLLIKSWFGITLLLIYLPLRFRIMLLNGYQIPLAVLATQGYYDHFVPWLQERLPRLQRPFRLDRSDARRAANILLLLAVLPTNLYLIAWRVYDLSEHDYPFYLNEDDFHALQWIEENAGPEDVILSSLSIGHYIPGQTGARPFLSNMVMTKDSDWKRAKVREFFDWESSDSTRRQLIEDFGIDFLFWGEAERRLGDYDPRASTFLVPLFISNRTILFSVVSP